MYIRVAPKNWKFGDNGPKMHWFRIQSRAFWPASRGGYGIFPYYPWNGQNSYSDIATLMKTILWAQLLGFLCKTLYLFRHIRIFRGGVLNIFKTIISYYWNVTIPIWSSLKKPQIKHMYVCMFYLWKKPSVLLGH